MSPRLAASCARAIAPATGVGRRSLHIKIADIGFAWVFDERIPDRVVSQFTDALRGFQIEHDGHDELGAREPADITVAVSFHGNQAGPPLVPQHHPRLRLIRRRFVDVARRFPVHKNPEALADLETAMVRERSTTKAVCRELERFADFESDAIVRIVGNSLLFVYPERGEAQMFVREATDLDAQRALKGAAYFTYAVVLPRFDALLLHAAGVRNEDEARVFMGTSGSGKSTVARLLRGHGVLADDGTAVRRQKCGFRVFPTPWQQTTCLLGHDRHRYQSGLELGEIFVLEQDERTYFEPLPQQEAMAGTLKSFVHCFKYMSQSGTLRTFELSRAIFSKADCYKMHFTKDDSFWSRIASLE